LGDSRGFFRRDFSSRVRRLVASGDAMVNPLMIWYLCGRCVTRR
jgi:hypothetical protein